MYVRSGMGQVDLSALYPAGFPGQAMDLANLPLTATPEQQAMQALTVPSLVAQAQPSASGATGISAWLSGHAGTVALIGGGFFALVFLSKAMR